MHTVGGASPPLIGNFSDLAQAADFADLPHPSREFTSLTGITLTADARAGAQGCHVRSGWR